MLLKKFLIIIGVILLLVVAVIGTRTFIDRRNNKQLIPTVITNPTKSSITKETAEVKEQEFNKKAYPLDAPGSIWVVVNKNRPLNPLEYAPMDLAFVGNNQQMRQEAAASLNSLVAAAKAAGLTIQADSGYRSYAQQVTVYNNEVASYGQTVADTESARAGYSEHQTGLAVDVGGGGCHIDNCFGDTAEGKWLATNAYTYGFIIRYTAEKQAVTGYRAEPWHIRYLGSELSNEMHKQNVLTLEEFFGLPAAPSYK